MWGRRSRRGPGRLRERERERERESGWVGGVPLKAPSSAHGLIQYVAQSVGNCSVLIKCTQQTKLNTKLTKPNKCRVLDQSM